MLFLSVGFTITSGQGSSLAPVNGVLDLSGKELDPQTILNLNGEWSFHWEELLTPENYAFRKSSGIICTVPSYWSSYQIDGKPLPGMGYGTYSLKIILPRGYTSSICFDIPVFDVAYAFYLNQRLMSSNGKVGTSKEEEQPWYEPSSFCYIPDGDTLQLLIQVSNFHHRRGGFWQPMFFGGADKVLDRKEKKRMYSYSTSGVLFFFMIFFLIFWSFTRKNKVMLLFALTTLGILMRSVNTGLYLSNFFIETTWNWQIRMEYLGSYLAFFFGIMFLHKLFPRRYMFWVIRGIAAVLALASISLFVLPVKYFSYEMLVYQPLVLLCLGHYLVISFLGTLKGKVLDSVFFISLALFIFTLVNDIMLANTGSAVSGAYLSELSFQLFILAMAVLVVMEWIRNNHERQRLEASLVFKNRVLSVIAHDLKAPIASVAQFSELLASKPELSSKPHVTNSLQQSSQAAVSLLDNLLYWGRSQADALQTSPTSFDFETLLKEVSALYQHMAIQKELKFTMNSEPGITVFADRVTMNIVVRNLVSNALKFTPQKGKVEIRAWKESGMLMCSVRDTGIGIKAEFLELFEKEGQLTSTPGTDHELGTGLGLQLVRELVKKNQGTLQVESKTEVGTTFTLTLPLDN